MTHQARRESPVLPEEDPSKSARRRGRRRQTVIATSLELIAAVAVTTVLAMTPLATTAPTGSPAQPVAEKGASPELGQPTAGSAPVTAQAPMSETSATTTAHNVTCTFPQGAVTAASLARELQGAVGVAASSGPGRVGASVYDWDTNLSCSYAGTHTFDSASIVKVTTLATMLWQAQKEGRSLTANERSWAEVAITQSDNDAQSSMWTRVGRGTGVEEFLKAAGMNHTTIDSWGNWGLTRVTADDQVLLLRTLTEPGLLSSEHRSYALTLMRSVRDDQRWGVTVGAPIGTTAANKNGWLPAAGGWRVNSIGVVSGSDHRYALAVMSDTNPSMAAGMKLVEQVAEAVHVAHGACPASTRPVRRAGGCWPAVRTAPLGTDLR